MKSKICHALILISLFMVVLSFQVVVANDLNETVDGDPFADFQKVIDESSASEINVTNDYSYHEGDNQITVNKSVVINGNNHIFDAKGESRIFNIQADNVVINNITLINGKYYDKDTSPFNIKMDGFGYDGYYGLDEVRYNEGFFQEATSSYYYMSSFKGGALYSSGNNLKIVNSRFINNYAPRGGSVFIEGDNSQIINCVFMNNTAKQGGAISNEAKNLFVFKSVFDFNNAKSNGNAIFSDGGININGCKFYNTSDNSVVFRGNWKIDNMVSNYFHSFIKLNYLDFKYNLTKISEDYYNFYIKFLMLNMCCGGLMEDGYGFSINKTFCLEINGQSFNLTTNENGEANLKLHLYSDLAYIKVFNPITKLSLFKVFHDTYINYNINPYCNSKILKTPIKFYKIIAKKNTIAKKPLKIKITVKNPSKKVLKVIFKGKNYKVKINKKGVGYFKLSKNIFKTLDKGKKYPYNIIYSFNNVLRYIYVK